MSSEMLVLSIGEAAARSGSNKRAIFMVEVRSCKR